MQNKMRWAAPTCAVLSMLAIAVCASFVSPWAVAAQHELADHDLNPEGSSGYIEKQVVSAPNFMVATAHPLATEAGYRMLRQGGSAMDAAIAAQLMLSLVEPQSSGIGGGGFVMHYDAAQGRVRSYDGRESAPAAASPEWFVRDGSLMSFHGAVNSGMSVGVPGLVKLLQVTHQAHGRLPWASLFEPAVTRAEQGFEVSHRLHAAMLGSPELADQAPAAAYFLDERGSPWPVGHVLRNPALAQTLNRIAQSGASAFYQGEMAQAVVEAVSAHPIPGLLTRQDMLDYQVIEREPLCGQYRAYRLCGMPPPGSGLTVLQLMGILQHFPMAEFAPGSADAVHYFSEAGRLAYADRDHYLADPDFIEVPVQALLQDDYLAKRAALIAPGRSLGSAQAGTPMPEQAMPGQDVSLELASTSQIVVVDAQGDVVSMTTTIESVFGSKIFVRGFLLNNELTDFSLRGQDAEGRWIANRVQSGKRPRSAMSPMIVFHDDQPFMAVGAPGGSAIINFVAKTLVGVLDWQLDIQQAISLPNFGSRNRQTELEQGTALQALVQPLRERGHAVSLREFPSGIQGIVIQSSGLQGGADPRREGTAQGG